ncbi:MAG: glutamine--scyllo-inositol aminotransferase [Nitrospira bacterium SG8_35_1]|nr:MAG: glutamine--scyllo-inositol aminotransferase [Nitrospira bacterium SG8_35_1]
MKKIPIAGPWISNEEIDTVTDAVTTSWYEGTGKYEQLFESSFAEYLGLRHAVSVPHCTSAIHLSLLALGVGYGDEVIVPDITWIASAAPISYVGAQPVFADIDPVTWCLHPTALESCISDKTKAIIVVDLYGGMPDMDLIFSVAQQHGLPVIEDAAEAIGSEYKNKKAGSFGKTGVFSFHGSKTLTTGEGGLLATNDTELYNRVLFLRDHGRIPGDVSFNNTEIAYKYKMSSLQAALGYAQLNRVEELVNKKRQIFSWYRQRLEDASYLQLNAEPKGTKNSYWMSSVIVDEKRKWPKLKLMKALAQRGIDSRPFFNPLSSIPAYKDSEQAAIARQRNQHAYQLSRQAINLPSALRLSQEDVTYVCEVLLELLQ